jgi:class 3 adenylate cyclase
VIVARRLCDRAAAGQIIASALVVGLLSARREFRFDDLGKLTLKGLADPLAVRPWWIRYYTRRQPGALAPLPARR